MPAVFPRMPITYVCSVCARMKGRWMGLQRGCLERLFLSHPFPSNRSPSPPDSIHIVIITSLWKTSRYIFWEVHFVTIARVTIQRGGQEVMLCLCGGSWDRREQTGTMTTLTAPTAPAACVMLSLCLVMWPAGDHGQVNHTTHGLPFRPCRLTHTC